MEFKVTKEAMRPASADEQCFYCQEQIGGTHKDDCVLVRKMATVKLVAEYPVEVPHSWDEESILFHRNESSWCRDNALFELKNLIETNGCLCLVDGFHFEVVECSGEPYLVETGKEQAGENCRTTNLEQENASLRAQLAARDATIAAVKEWAKDSFPDGYRDDEGNMGPIGQYCERDEVIDLRSLLSDEPEVLAVVKGYMAPSAIRSMAGGVKSFTVSHDKTTSLHVPITVTVTKIKGPK